MKRKILRAFLKSALIVCVLLLCVLLADIVQMVYTDSGTASENDRLSILVDTEQTSRHTDPDDAEKTNRNASKKVSSSPKAPAARDTTLVFAGDVYFSDYILAAYDQSGIQGVLAKSLLREFKQADITMVNNEFPYSTRGVPAPDKQFTFRIDPSYVSLLKESGTDIVTLANNHVLDYGTQALSDTFQTLDDAGIAYAGAGNSIARAQKLITKKVNGHTFGFLAASRVFPVATWNVENAQPGVLSAYDPTRLIAAVQKARSRCDFLCVYVHWGIERNPTPEDYQVSMAHALIEAGADAVIGAHPHILQGVEFYQGKPIFYSLGNFIFYQTIEQTAIAKLTLTTDLTAQWQLLPATASMACTALLKDPAACQDFYTTMTGLSTNVSFSDQGILTPSD